MKHDETTLDKIWNGSNEGMRWRKTCLKELKPFLKQAALQFFGCFQPSGEQALQTFGKSMCGWLHLAKPACSLQQELIHSASIFYPSQYWFSNWISIIFLNQVGLATSASYRCPRPSPVGKGARRMWYAKFCLRTSSHCGAQGWWCHRIRLALAIQWINLLNIHMESTWNLTYIYLYIII